MHNTCCLNLIVSTVIAPFGEGFRLLLLISVIFQPLSLRDIYVAYNISKDITECDDATKRQVCFAKK